MIALAVQQFLARWQRSIAVCIAVILGVAFFTIALLAGGPLNQNLRTGVGQQIHGADLVITINTQGWTGEELDSVLEIDGVATADMASFSPGEVSAGGTTSYLLFSDLPTVPAVRDNIELREGHWPTGNGEIALSTVKMSETGIEPGDDVELMSWNTEESATFTVVGVFESPSGLASGRANAFLSGADYERLAPSPYSYAMRIALTEDADAAQTLDTVQTALGSDYTAWTFNDYIEQEVEAFAGNTVALQVALGAFAFIALCASGIVIANSFEISIAQRIREIGLLRSVGATNRQIRRLVLTEALFIGVVASIAGVALGIGIMELAGRIWWAKGGSSGVELTPVTIGVPILIGAIATVAAALAPARSAMRVHPLQAIRQSDAPVFDSRSSRRRSILAGLLLVAGIVVMGIASMLALNGEASTGIPVLMGIAGGALTFLAILISSQVIIPMVARLFGSLSGRLFGVTGEIANGNLGRNPKRTASAAAALLMGVTLMSMMTVGSASVKSSIVSEVKDREPIDLEIRMNGLSSSRVDADLQISRWQSVEGVDMIVPTRIAEIEIGESGSWSVLSVHPDNAKLILRSDGLADLSDSTVLVTDDWAFQNGLSEGDSIQVQGEQSTATLQVLIRRSGVSEPVISTNTMSHLNGEGETAGAWIRLKDDASVADVMTDVRVGLPESLEVTITGGAEERESILDVLDSMLMVVLGLLAAAVVIAVVGIGNTLTLSVVERTRESGMLRAMGLKRGQIRGMLALEGVAISLVGALIGIVLGILYGFAGVLTLFGDTLDFTFAVPWGQLGLICLVAIASGLLASVLPARRALAIKPVEALSNIG